MLSVFAENRSPDFYKGASKQIVQKGDGTIMAIPESYLCRDAVSMSKVFQGLK